MVKAYCIFLIVGTFLICPGCKPESTSQKPSSAKGLYVIQARYGACGTSIDVTDEIRAKLQDNTLSIEVSNSIAGDPFFGVIKSLSVEYVLDGERRTTQMREGEVLRIPPDVKGHAELQAVKTSEQLIALAKQCPAEVGFFGKNLRTDKTVEYRADQSVCLASIVKIFVLLEVIHQVDQTKLSLTDSITISYKDKRIVCTISEALDKMIGLSDNAATNALAARVGYDRVNSLPEELGITGLSKKILPEPRILERVLDKRVYGGKLLSAADLLPQHGTARGIVQYFELLNREELINAHISRRVIEAFDKNPKNFAPGATPIDFRSGGKGGSLVWKRLFRPQYNMTGWGIIIRGEKTAIAFCLWSEWFPEKMKDREREQWLMALSDSIVNVLLTEELNTTGQKQTLQLIGPSDLQ